MKKRHSFTATRAAQVNDNAAHIRVEAMATSDACHLCRATRITQLLGVAVGRKDGSTSLIREKCKRRIVTLEKAAEDLVEFQTQIQQCHDNFCRGLKSTKNTSGDFAFPSTLKAKPPSKWVVNPIGRRLQFEQSSSTGIAA